MDPHLLEKGGASLATLAWPIVVPFCDQAPAKALERDGEICD